MTRWFRHYASLCRDEKLVSVAIKSRQPVERVVWIWCAILESAAEIDDNGRYDFDAAEAAYFLRADEADICSVIKCLEAFGRVSENCVVKWGNRQFVSDRSKDRVAAYRERKRAGLDKTDSQEPSRNDAVTLQSRHSNAPETETETEEDISSLRSDTALVAKAPEKPILAKPKSPEPNQEKFEEFWQVYPKRDGSNPKEPARQKFNQAVKRGEDPEAIISAAKRYAEQQKRLGNIGTPYVKQATSWLNAKCWLDDYGTAALMAGSEDANAKAREFLGRLSASQIESYVQRYFVGQFQWNSGQLGPPPDRPGTLIPPDLINRVKQKQEQAA